MRAKLCGTLTHEAAHPLPRADLSFVCGDATCFWYRAISTQGCLHDKGLRGWVEEGGLGGQSRPLNLCVVSEHLFCLKVWVEH
jgi:hypothetical protein